MPSVTERSAVDLAAGIRRRELTSLEIVDAHVQRLRATHAQINAVVADRYEDALAEAQVCDQRIAQAALRGEPLDELPPLYGVPFTVKESIAVEGMPQTAGVLARKDQKGAVTATAVQRLIDAGAILLGVTNTSELTLWIESDNQIYGRTNNPYDRSRTAGGSSGGEGAAVGVGGSPFGIGADIGGSIRIPALFNGVFGHKPSRGLVPNTGIWPTVNPSAETLLATGPLTRRAEDLMPLLRILAAADLPDPAEVS
jgi:fatty acid amide hydrolase 2